MSEKKTMAKDELMAAITQATSGLLFHSESDAPLEPYRWTASSPPTVDRARQALGQPEDTPVEELGLRALFDPILEEQSFWTDDDRAEAGRYRALVELLEKELDDLRVYRVGKVDVDILILGQRRGGDWMGLKTHEVET